MHILLTLSFKVAKKEPLAALLQRVTEALENAGVHNPGIEFSLADTSFAGGVSSVDRVLKRWPDMAAYLNEEPSFPGMPPVRKLKNSPPDAGISLARLAEIADGVPKSFPFESVSITLTAPEFSLSPESATHLVVPGLTITDSWWVTGRRRGLSAQLIVEAGIDQKSLPSLPDRLATIAMALGPYKTMQMPLAGLGATPQAPTPKAQAAELSAEASTRIAEICRMHRENFAAKLASARLPHDLPSAADALRTALASGAGRQPTDAKKGALQRAFKPLGYEITSGSGTFTLCRRTPANHTIEIYLDVGTWSRKLNASYRLVGLGFVAKHPLAVSAKDSDQSFGYPIADAEGWRQMVENLAALVNEIDKTFPVEIESAAGPSPDWFEPAGN